MTERDVAILAYVAQNRFATAAVIEARFWNGRAHRHHYRRLRWLQRARLIEPLLGDCETRLGYQITDKGARLLRKRGFDIPGLNELRRSYRTSFDHERLLLDVRNILETSSIVSDYQPEHVVRSALVRKYGSKESASQGYKVPDAIFSLRTSARVLRIGLELEIAWKSKERYRKLLRQLATSPDFDIVFFLVKESAILQCLKFLLAEVCTHDPAYLISEIKHGVYFALLGEFLEKKLEGTFEGEGKTFSLKGLAEEQGLPAARQPLPLGYERSGKAGDPASTNESNVSPRSDTAAAVPQSKTPSPDRA